MLNHNPDILLLGDLNIDCSSYQIGNKIYDLCQLFDLEQLVTSPTRETISSSTLIDVILSNLGARHTLTDVKHISLSDHYMIYTVIDFNVKVAECNYLKCRSFKNFNVDAFNNDLSTKLANDCHGSSINDYWDSFKRIFTSVSDIHAPVRTFKIKSNSKPWITGDLVDLMKYRDKLHKLAVTNKNADFEHEYRKVRNQDTSQLRSAKRNFFMNELDNRTNSADIWKSLNSLITESNSDKTVSTDFNCLELNEYFVGIGPKLIEPFKDLEPVWKGPDSIHNFTFTPIPEPIVKKEIVYQANPTLIY